jgi:D-amino-acid oxidase
MSMAANEPTPDFTFDPDAQGACIAGVRPHRHGAYRLEHDRTIANKFLVHNYGYGGCGISLSWGCAARVREIVQTHLATSHDTSAAVLGAGVMGLTAATLLLDLGLKVKIYSDRMPDKTTSFKAGGQWSLSGIESTGKEQELSKIATNAYTTFKNSIGKGFGVSEHKNYTTEIAKDLEDAIKAIPADVFPRRVDLPNGLPLEGHTGPGYRYKTLLVEPPIFIPRLQADLHARGVDVTLQKAFTAPAQVLMLTENIIINCTGLGSATLFDDDALKPGGHGLLEPITGQLAMLPAQPALQYLYGSHGGKAYMFPRADHVVIGGTFQHRVNNETPDKATCQNLVAAIAQEFGKRLDKGPDV